VQDGEAEGITRVEATMSNNTILERTKEVCICKSIKKIRNFSISRNCNKKH